MDRRDFMKMFGVGTAAAVAVPSIAVHNPKEAVEELPVVPQVPEAPEVPLEQHVYESFTIKDEEYEANVDRQLVNMRNGRGRTELRNATITFTDQDNRVVKLGVGEGSLTWTEHRDYEYRLDRGVLDEIVCRDEEPLELSLDMVYEWIQCDDFENWQDILRETHFEDLEMIVTVDRESYAFRGFAWDTMEYDVASAVFSISGRCINQSAWMA